MIDIKAIREAAEAATPGPWEYRQLEWGNYVTADGQTSVCQSALSRTASMKHIATANPATVLAMCDEIERLRKDAARYQWLKDRATASHVQHYKLDYPTTWHIVTGGSDTNIDAAIDAAMESK